MFSPIEPEPLFYAYTWSDHHVTYGNYKEIIEAMGRDGLMPDLFQHTTSVSRRGPLQIVYSHITDERTKYINHGRLYTISIPYNDKQLARQIKECSADTGMIQALYRKFGINNWCGAKSTEDFLTLLVYILELDDFKRIIFLAYYHEGGDWSKFIRDNPL